MDALTTIKAMMDNSVIPSDEELGVYLDMAKEEILYWTFGRDTEMTEVPSWLVPIQTMAVMVGINGRGAEGEDYEAVDNVTHNFRYADMLEYIHQNAPSYVKVDA